MHWQVSHYRFSLSWSRIMPLGFGAVNQAGIDFYNDFIDMLLAANIVPMVTLYHWDLPQAIETQFGGWPNRSTADLFEAYADVCYEAFGDRVSHVLNCITIYAFVAVTFMFVFLYFYSLFRIIKLSLCMYIV